MTRDLSKYALDSPSVSSNLSSLSELPLNDSSSQSLISSDITFSSSNNVPELIINNNDTTTFGDVCKYGCIIICFLLIVSLCVWSVSRWIKTNMANSSSSITAHEDNTTTTTCTNDVCTIVTCKDNTCTSISKTINQDNLSNNSNISSETKETFNNMIYRI